MWDLPKAGIEPMSPALAGRFSTTVLTGKPGMLQYMGWQRVGHDWATELNWPTWHDAVDLGLCSKSFISSMSPGDADTVGLRNKFENLCSKFFSSLFKKIELWTELDEIWPKIFIIVTYFYNWWWKKLPKLYVKTQFTKPFYYIS